MATKRPLILNSNGSTAEIATGDTIPIANLASGTPDGTKFIRDDGTLVTPATGGISDGTKLEITVSAAGTKYAMNKGLITMLSRGICL
jgi:hypothetical protein